ncbi:uncharacterized protein LOC131148683 [Malania oleifera]|uniref:uncharacterized protein LOC131148683 n=1 Tax=Malania oleifera TaxID=397392 RepID=UPI0025AD9EC6|nr:uncharacterized protein LOC131148683 [Malania oleifera]
MAAGVIVELQRNSPNWAKLVEDIVRLEKKIFPKHESLSSFFEEELRKKNSGLLYCEIDGELIGYVMHSRPSSLCTSITKLAVKENYRRQGHGEALLKAAIGICKSRKALCVSLHVDPSRIPALNLYKKLGFQVDNLIKNYYSSDRNAYKMFLNFDAE